MSKDNTALSPEELQRYARHLSLPELGLAGQAKLRAASVLIVGTGGLGSPVAMYLAAAGVGRLGMIDFDRVEYSNLQRQIIHTTDSVGRSKVASAAEAVARINPLITVDAIDAALTSENAMSIAGDYDIIIDGTDNFATRYLVNDVCVLLKKPNCYGSIFRFEGQASVFGHAGGPCYRCLYPQPPAPGTVPNCAEGGVLGILPGIVGTIQATEAIKLILGIGNSLSGRLLLIDAAEMRFRELKVRRSADCPVCGDAPTITAPIDYDQFCGSSPASEETDVQSRWDIEASELKQMLDDGTEFVLVDVREPHEHEICSLGGTLIPLAELTDRQHELPTDKTIVVHCKLGGRSAQAAHQLRELGFKDVRNLRGGIDAWATQIDPSMPRY
ncbi:putative adenylyltransferase/sulfurtransferase MoeZ [Novipirellula galeiformis]|uniref:Molybdopterin-synthase adenylyltransferase n=1 Tax=Novipirellula galeiformis TaxID=2528004 RepID=A0A5C6CP56_9BACT|nr:molybdopterin-synthase adenylyltransferase MoeB [Novipirellula galeiformis]TWU25397.1 putative adenylyltransferase/sulfurtransferase MoeZ [Novipirellula galeiformis]